MAKRLIGLAFLALATALAGGPAAAQNGPGDAAAGRNFAQRNCSSCHLVTDQPIWPPLSRAPTFASVARSPETTELGLRAFLQTPHARMPNLVLNRSETDDVISYILSLRKR